MAAKKRKYKPRRKTDPRYQEISSELAEKTKKQEREGCVQEMYIDAQRGISVVLGGPETDLKTAMDKSGIKTTLASELLPGQPNDDMYLKQAEHLMRKGALKPALVYVNIALKMNPESKNAKASKAKCQLLMGNWNAALEAANQVLEVDQKFVKAVFVKAESLYNMCNFEHALIFFHRGQRMSPDHEDFRLGIQKCRKTIRDGVKNEQVFQGKSSEVIFNIMRKAAEFRSLKPLQQQQQQQQWESHVEEAATVVGAVKSLIKMTSGFSLRTKNKSTTKRKIFAANPNPNHFNECREIFEAKEVTTIAPFQYHKRGVGPGVAAKVTRVQARCRAKARMVLSEDRLLVDKLYLKSLATGIQDLPGDEEDQVKQEITETAEEALIFLRAREEFWRQLKIGQKVAHKK